MGSEDAVHRDRASLVTGRIGFRWTASVAIVPECPTSREISSEGLPLSESSETKLWSSTRPERAVSEPFRDRPDVVTGAARPLTLSKVGSPGPDR
jgi:hypothetical protein